MTKIHIHKQRVRTWSSSVSVRRAVVHVVQGCTDYRLGHRGNAGQLQTKGTFRVELSDENTLQNILEHPSITIRDIISTLEYFNPMIRLF